VVTITAPATPGSYTFIVKWDKSVSPPDVTGSGPSVAFDLTVEAPNEPPTVDAGGPYNGSEGSAVSLDGTATDPDGDPVTTSWSYAAVTADSGATCDFGDAGAADTTVTCTDDGTFTLTLTADDGVNDPVSDSTTLTLSNADPSATPSIPAGDVNEGDSFSLSLSSPSDPGANDTFTYQFDCGDGGGYNAASSTASRTCPTTDNGSRAVKLKILDDDGGFAEYTGDVTVVNVPPVVTSFTCPTGPVAVNTSVTLTGAFTDVGTADTHTASIAWGDGNSAAATVTQGAGSGSVSGSHAYGAAGIYTPSLTVTDDDGGSDAESCEYVVVYDPSAGFVTGGGWITSPAGAFLADPTMTGKATFGFVSKYKKGANVPDGSTEFQFHAAGLNFKSTAYQWLVVAGSKATYKGWGTINGLGNYGFLLSALDGSPDKFRIKIWDVGSGDVVYDNNLGGGDDADPATGLGGGSIVIHTGKK
jgi:hypothetical protein